MNFEITIIADAEDDMMEIYNHVATNDSIQKAEFILNRLEETCLSLKKYPNRGQPPPELDRIGISAFKEVHFKPYRIIYQISGSVVYIHCVLDGRRSLQELLEKRLLR